MCERAHVRCRVFVYFLAERTIVQRRGDCVYLSLFSSAGGWGGCKTEEEREKKKQIFEEFERENITNMGIWGMREWRRDRERERRETQLRDINSFVIRLTCEQAAVYLQCELVGRPAEE